MLLRVVDYRGAYCGGTSFEGRVSDPNMAPILGSVLCRVQERVCVMVAAVQYQLGLSLPKIVVPVRGHLSLILDGGYGGFWWYAVWLSHAGTVSDKFEPRSFK